MGEDSYYVLLIKVLIACLRQKDTHITVSNTPIVMMKVLIYCVYKSHPETFKRQCHGCIITYCQYKTSMTMVKFFCKNSNNVETHKELSQTSKMELFVKKVNI